MASGLGCTLHDELSVCCSIGQAGWCDHADIVAKPAGTINEDSAVFRPASCGSGQAPFLIPGTGL